MIQRRQFIRLFLKLKNKEAMNTEKEPSLESQQAEATAKSSAIASQKRETETAENERIQRNNKTRDLIVLISSIISALGVIFIITTNTIDRINNHKDVVNRHHKIDTIRTEIIKTFKINKNIININSDTIKQPQPK